MQRYEYKVIPGPRKAEKAKGLKTAEDRFAHALTTLMNDLGRDGWEYQRSDTLPCDERVGLTGSKTTFQTVLVFRRAIDAGSLPAALPEGSSAPVVPVIEVPPPTIPTIRVGAAEAPMGAAPSLGPAPGPGTTKTDLAAE